MRVFVLGPWDENRHMDINSTHSCFDYVCGILESVLFDSLVCRERVVLRSMLYACQCQYNVKHVTHMNWGGMPTACLRFTFDNDILIDYTRDVH